MPNVIMGDSTLADIAVGDGGYNYPMGLNLKPSSALHSSIVSKVLNMAREAKAAMEPRHEKWKKIDQTLTAFIPKDGKDQTNVIVPMSYATLDTLLTAWTTLFTTGPIFRYKGQGPEDKVSAMLLELAVDSQCRRQKTLLNLHTMWRDSIAYGLGVVGIRWESKFGKRTVVRNEGYTSNLSGMMMSDIPTRRTERGVIYEANALDNWEVYNYLVDPNVASSEVQKAAFVGHIERTDYNALLKAEQDQPDTYFNVQHLKGIGQWNSSLRTDTSYTDIARKGDASMMSSVIKGDVLRMYVTLIPSDWKLGKSKYPEIWLFEIAGDRIIIRAQPTAFAHDMYPVAVASPTADGHSVSPVSILEMVQPMQDALDWFFRSHFHNVRKSLNNMLIVDPYLVNYNDIANPEPGKIIRIRENVWGRGVENAVKQLEVHDITRTNIADMGATVDLLQRITGAVDSLQGIVRTGGERRSATEMRDTRMAALSRIQKQAMLAGLTAMQDIGYMFARHIQQFQSKDMFLELVGDNKAELTAIYGADSLAVNPLDFVCDFDVSVADGSSSGGEYVNEMLQMFQITRSDPALAQAFDPVRMALDIMRKAGIKSPTDFLTPQWKMQLMPDEQALNMAADNDMMPVPLSMQAPPNMSASTGPSALPAGIAGQSRGPSPAMAAPMPTAALPQIVEDAIYGR